MKKQPRKFWGTDGVFIAGQGVSGEISGPIEVLFATLLGGMAGLVAGMIVGTFARIVTTNRVKGMIGGMHWGAFGAGAGALTLAVYTLLN